MSDHGHTQTGLLTAGHVLGGAAVGDSVDLASTLYKADGKGTVLVFGPPRVDAAIVGQPPGQNLWTTGAGIQIPGLPPAPGTPTTMRGQAGGITPRTLMSNSNPALSVDHNYRAVEFLILLNKPGRDGDSGALVQHANTGEGLGLYLGTADDVTGSVVMGRCQLLRQVELVFNAKLYEWP